MEIQTLTGTLVRPISGENRPNKLSILVTEKDGTLTHHILRFDENQNPEYRCEDIKDKHVTVTVTIQDDPDHMYPMITDFKIEKIS